MPAETLLETHLERFFAAQELHRGKVRDSYGFDSMHRLIVATDRVSAFDRVLGTIPSKGQVLNQLSAWWFSNMPFDHHFIEIVDPQAMCVVPCKPFSIEFVVRGYLTGSTNTSIWTHYAKGTRVFCGNRLPDHLKKHARFDRPIVTPTTKGVSTVGAVGHDENVSYEMILEHGWMQETELDVCMETARALFAMGQALCEKSGLILADTKYEFGKTADGKIRLIDEVHTPDSSRFWDRVEYEDAMRCGRDPEALDKEHLRKWLRSEGFSGDGPIPLIPETVLLATSQRYQQTFERITHRPFVADAQSPEKRIVESLKRYDWAQKAIL